MQTCMVTYKHVLDVRTYHHHHRLLRQRQHIKIHTWHNILMGATWQIWLNDWFMLDDNAYISSVVTCLLSNQKLHFGIFISRYMSTAHSKMQKRVTDLVLESFGTQSYKKAMDCLRVLREESIKVHRIHHLWLDNTKFWHRVHNEAQNEGQDAWSQKLRLRYFRCDGSFEVLFLKFLTPEKWFRFSVSVFGLDLKPVRHGFEPPK